MTLKRERTVYSRMGLKDKSGVDWKLGFICVSQVAHITLCLLILYTILSALSGVQIPLRLDDYVALISLLTSSLVANRYHNGVFAAVWLPASLQRYSPLARLAHWWMRANAVIFAVPIVGSLLALRAVFMFTGLGLACVTMNNFLCYRYAQLAARDIGETFRVTTAKARAVESFLPEFQRWYFGTLIYAASAGVIGWLYYTEVYNDPVVYGGGVALLNMMMYVFTCNLEGPRIRRGLQWYVVNHQRALRYADTRQRRRSPVLSARTATE